MNTATGSDLRLHISRKDLFNEATEWQICVGAIVGVASEAG